MLIVSFLSDFGTSDSYVAEVKAVLLSQSPSLVLVDISHQVAAGDVRAAAFLIERTWWRFPPGTVHLVVVDPGWAVNERPWRSLIETISSSDPTMGFSLSSSAIRELASRPCPFRPMPPPPFTAAIYSPPPRQAWQIGAGFRASGKSRPAKSRIAWFAPSHAWNQRVGRVRSSISIT